MGALLSPCIEQGKICGADGGNHRIAEILRLFETGDPIAWKEDSDRLRSSKLIGIMKTKTRKFKKSRWLPPYKSNGKKTTFNEVRKRSGVYIIKRGKDVLYVGFSGSQLYKTLYRHFQAWNHPFQSVVTYRGQRRADFRVRVVLCSPARAERLEGYLIRKLEPIDNPDKLENLRLSAVAIRDAAAMKSAPVSIIDEDPF
jgi:hypothetical protein